MGSKEHGERMGMSEDIIAQAEEACKAPYYDEGGGMRDENWQRIFERCDLLPQLLAEAKAWKATAIEERARSVAFGDRKEFWEQLSEEFAGYCILEATKMLAEEMRKNE